MCEVRAGLRISEDVLSWQAVGLVSRVRARGWLFFGMVVFCVIVAVSLFLFVYIIAKPCSLLLNIVSSAAPCVPPSLLLWYPTKSFELFSLFEIYNFLLFF